MNVREILDDLVLANPPQACRCSPQPPKDFPMFSCICPEKELADFLPTSNKNQPIFLTWSQKTSRFSRDHPKELADFSGGPPGKLAEFMFSGVRRIFPPNFSKQVKNKGHIFSADFLSARKQTFYTTKPLFIDWQKIGQKIRPPKTDAPGDLPNFSLKWTPRWHGVKICTSRCQTNPDARLHWVFSKKQLRLHTNSNAKHIFSYFELFQANSRYFQQTLSYVKQIFMFFNSILSQS